MSTFLIRFATYQSSSITNEKLKTGDQTQDRCVRGYISLPLIHSNDKQETFSDGCVSEITYWDRSVLKQQTKVKLLTNENRSVEGLEKQVTARQKQTNSD